MLSHLLLHCSDALCVKLRNYKCKHDKYCTSFTLFSTICIIYNVLVVVVVVVEINFNSIKKNECNFTVCPPFLYCILKRPSVKLQFTVDNITREYRVALRYQYGVCKLNRRRSILNGHFPLLLINLHYIYIFGYSYEFSGSYTNGKWCCYIGEVLLNCITSRYEPNPHSNCPRPSRPNRCLVMAGLSNTR